MEFLLDNAGVEFLKQNLDTKGALGCDSALGNLFFMHSKGNIQLFVHENMLLRYFCSDKNEKNAASINKSDSRTGWGFPLSLRTGSSDDESLKKALEFIIEKSKEEGFEPAFCFCTLEQKNKIAQTLATHFPPMQITWNSNRGDSDYLYLQKNLAELGGTLFQKKRNHILRFLRTYGDSWSFKLFPQNDIASDILVVEEAWFNQKNEPQNPYIIKERDYVKTALENAELLKLCGGVLYIEQKPVAMTLATPVSPEVLDVHFEKAVFEHEANGVYAMINNLFAKSQGSFLYFNREEDLGVEGLRKAKLSYKPAVILDKFYGRIM